MQLTNVFFREALLSAAASGALNSAQDKVNNNNQTSIVQPPKHLNNNLANNNLGKGQINKPQPQKVSNGVQRKPSTSSIPEKKRETIWDFFEQGNKKGTCRYVLKCLYFTFIIIYYQNLWLRCQLQEQQGRPDPALVPGTPEGVQDVHRQDGAQLDQRDAGEEPQHEGACQPVEK